MAKSNNKTHQKRMDKNCHIPDLVQAFYDNGTFKVETKLTTHGKSKDNQN